MTTKKNITDWRIVIATIVALVILEGFALYLGHNGIILSVVLAMIAGLAGWASPQLKTK